jgi:N-acetylglucosamine-6-phosphate deacetylase
MSNYFDIQVNGYGGVDFNQDDLQAADLHPACQKLAADGVGGILATIITDSPEAMTRRIQRVVALREKDDLAQKIIAGIHIEGPFISPVPGYKGAHPDDAIRPADLEIAKRFLEAAGGLTKIFTLAPEQDAGFELTKWLAAQGITVSAGHTNASLEQLQGAIDAGLKMFTHLGNGCPMQIHRHDNIIQRALSLHEHIWCCFIADNVHVPYLALGNYLRAAGLDRCIVTTDAMAAAGMGPGRYKIGRWDMLVGEDQAAWAPDRSHLLGSAISMKQSEEKMKGQMGLSGEQVKLLTEINPRKAVGV